MKTYTLDELNALPTLAQGMTDDLKVQEAHPNGTITKVWLSRLTVEDGMMWNNTVTVERCFPGGNWHTVRTYKAG